MRVLLTSWRLQLKISQKAETEINEAASTKKNTNENLTPKEINAACENGVKLQPFFFQKRELK